MYLHFTYSKSTYEKWIYICVSITGRQIKDVVTPLIFGGISRMTIYGVKNAIRSYSNIIRLE